MAEDDGTVRVAIVDDEPLVRTGLRAIVESEPGLAVVGEAGDGADVPDLVRRVRPDVVLMDVRMPGLDGIAATAALGRTGSATRVLVVTTFENDDYVLDALRAGASGFLLKRARPERIVEAIRVVARGEAVLFPEAVRRLVTGRAPDGTPSSSVEHERALARLTDREREVLRLVAAGRTNAEIAAQLWLGVETVKTHVGNVLAKLGARDRLQAAIVAYSSGFVVPGE